MEIYTTGLVRRQNERQAAKPNDTCHTWIKNLTFASLGKLLIGSAATWHPVLCVITSETDLAARILDLLSFTPAVNHASRTIHYSNLPNEATVIMTLGVQSQMHEPCRQDSYKYMQCIHWDGFLTPVDVIPGRSLVWGCRVKGDNSVASYEQLSTAHIWHNLADLLNQDGSSMIRNFSS
jgi:hypothetical protein